MSEVSVERGGAGCLGYLDDLVGRGDDVVLRITPIAARALASFTGPWRISDAAGRWSVLARVVTALADDVLDVSLRDLRPHDPPLRRPYDTSGLLLACPVEALGLQVFPIVELSAAHCVLESATPFPPGHEFPIAEIVGDTGVLRRCAATLRTTSPWWTSDGESRFRLACALSSRADELAMPRYDVIDDPQRIRRTLELAALLQRPIDVDGAVQARLLEVGRSSLRVSPTSAAPERLKLAFDVFELRYECHVRRLDPGHFSLPLVLRCRRFRAESRARTPSAFPLSVRYDHPIERDARSASVLDLSQGGMSFVPGDAILWTGLRLPKASLTVPDQPRPIPLGPLEIREQSENRAHVKFLSDEVLSSVEFGHVLARLRHPDLAPHDGEHFERQLDLYRHANLVMPYMAERLVANRDRARDAWRRAHHDAPGLAFTFARYEGAEAVASVSALQAWEQTWLAQHLAARRARRGCSPGELFIAALDHLILRPDCRRMVFFTTVGNAKMNGIQSHFQSVTGTPEALSKTSVSAWLLRPCGGRGVSTRRCSPRDARTIENAVRRDMGRLAAQALSFEADTLSMRRLSATFRRFDLRRGRDVWILDGPGKRASWALVLERASPGLCVPGLLDATWVLPLRRTPIDPALEALHTLPLEEGEPARLVLFPFEVEADTLRGAGLEHAFDANIYVFNRAGLRRYVSFLTETFGEMSAKVLEAAREAP